MSTTSHRQHQHAGHAETSLNRLSVSATNHCLTGCVLGEVTGMTIATALGSGHIASIALAVGLAFLFGYRLTSLPLLRAKLPSPRSSRSRSPPTPSRSRSWK